MEKMFIYIKRFYRIVSIGLKIYVVKNKNFEDEEDFIGF